MRISFNCDNGTHNTIQQSIYLRSFYTIFHFEGFKIIGKNVWRSWATKRNIGKYKIINQSMSNITMCFSLWNFISQRNPEAFLRNFIKTSWNKLGCYIHLPSNTTPNIWTDVKASSNALECGFVNSSSIILRYMNCLTIKVGKPNIRPSSVSLSNVGLSTIGL